MNKKVHEALQKSIDRMQKNNDELTRLLLKYATNLGEAINYKHEKKSEYRIFVCIEDKEYDMDDLLGQTLDYIGKTRVRK